MRYRLGAFEWHVLRSGDPGRCSTCRKHHYHHQIIFRSPSLVRVILVEYYCSKAIEYQGELISRPSLSECNASAGLFRMVSTLYNSSLDVCFTHHKAILGSTHEVEGLRCFCMSRLCAPLLLLQHHASLHPVRVLQSNSSS